MGWFKFLPSQSATELTQAPVRRAIKKFIPKDDIEPTAWMSVPLGDIDLVTSLDSSLNEVADYDSFTVVYEDDLAEDSATYTVVDSAIFNGRLYFQAAENHVANQEINKKYYVYYRYNNIQNLLLGEKYYYVIGDNFVDTPLVFNPKELHTYETGYYSFSFINDNLNWNKGFTELIDANVKVVFSGPEIQLYGNKGPDYGAIAVKYSAIKKQDFEILPISEQTKTIDLYSSEEQSDVLLYSVVNLDYRDYVLDVTTVKSNNPKSSGSKVVLSRADFYYFVNSEILSEEVYSDISFNNVRISGTKTTTLQNLKPGKEYILTVKAKNSDININSDFTKTVKFTVPEDNTKPSDVSNLSLYQSLQNVMFVFDYVTDLDIRHYEYELYDSNSISGTLVSSGINSANVFSVSVDNLQDEDSGSGLVSYWGRVRAIDTSGNEGDWTSLVKTSGDSPLIDSQYINSLSASKITAGTIGSHTITLNGANSLLQSSTYDSSSGENGWYIGGDGHFSLGGPDGITYDNQTIVIGSDVQVQANLAADSISVGSGTNAVLNINDTINNGGGGMTLGDPSYNYWYANGNFRAGGATRYIEWDGSGFTIRGDLRFNDNTIPGTFDNGDALTAGTIGGLFIGTSKVYSGSGNYNNADTGFYLDSNGDFSLKNKLSFDASESALTINGTVYAAAGTIGGVTIGSSKIYTGTGTYANTNTGFYLDSSGNFSLKNKLTWNGTTLSINGSVTSTSGRIGPFDMTSTSLKSTGYSATNYMEILSYGDLYIYSNPTSGGHANQKWKTSAVGEWLEISRTDGTSYNHTTLLGQWYGGNSGPSLELRYNGAAKVLASAQSTHGTLQLWNSSGTNTIHLNGSNGTVTGSNGTLSRVTPCTSIDRVHDTTRTSSGTYTVTLGTTEGGVSVSGATGVFLTVTADSYNGNSGYGEVKPYGQGTTVNGSCMNWDVGNTSQAGVYVSLDSSRRFRYFISAGARVIIDVTGFTF